MIEGEKVYGVVRDGIITIPANCGVVNPFNKPLRGIVPIGLPLFNPAEAVEANRQGRFYVPNIQRNAGAILKSLRGAIPIDERDVNYNVLELILDEFDSKYARYTLPLYGGDGSEQMRIDRVKNAAKYFREQLDKAGKSEVKSQKLYLPPVDEQEIIGTQIFSGGLDYEFGLAGFSRILGNANGVFGVSE